MDMLLFNEGALVDLALLNGNADARQLSPATLADGRQVLNADLLNDCGPAGTWAGYAVLLQSLPIIAVTAEDWPAPPA